MTSNMSKEQNLFKREKLNDKKMHVRVDSSTDGDYACYRLLTIHITYST